MRSEKRVIFCGVRYIMKRNGMGVGKVRSECLDLPRSGGLVGGSVATPGSME